MHDLEERAKQGAPRAREEQVLREAYQQTRQTACHRLRKAQEALQAEAARPGWALGIGGAKIPPGKINEAVKAATVGGTFQERFHQLQEAWPDLAGCGSRALAQPQASRGNSETGDGGTTTEAEAAAARGQHRQVVDLCGGDLAQHAAAYAESAPGVKKSRLRPGERSPEKSREKKRIVRALDRDAESGRWVSGTNLGQIAPHHTQWWGAIARRRRVVPSALPTARRSTVGRRRPRAVASCRRRTGGTRTRAGPDSDPSEQPDSDGVAGPGPASRHPPAAGGGGSVVGGWLGPSASLPVCLPAGCGFGLGRVEGSFGCGRADDRGGGTNSGGGAGDAGVPAAGLFSSGGAR